jgi:4'-phosphopantetheinyl transferase
MSSSLSLWSPPPPKIELADAQVHLWRFRLDLPSDKIAGLSQLLSNEEQLRAKRLLDRLKANSFIAARGQMRQILARYLVLKPENINFSYGEHGKPYLADGRDKNLAFNLSHAGRWGLLVITSGADVGVDIEQIDRQLDFEGVASGFFSLAEIDELRRYPLARRRRAFYRIWTRKESCLKKEGYGFSSPQISVHDAKWQIRSFTVDRGYLGAIAVTGDLPDIWRWNFTA